MLNPPLSARCPLCRHGEPSQLGTEATNVTFPESACQAQSNTLLDDSPITHQRHAADAQREVNLKKTCFGKTDAAHQRARTASLLRRQPDGILNGAADDIGFEGAIRTWWPGRRRKRTPPSRRRATQKPRGNRGRLGSQGLARSRAIGLLVWRY